MRLFQNQDLNEVLGKNLIENQEPHQEPHQKSRTSSRISSKIKILGKTSLRFSLRFSMRIFFSLRISMRTSMRSCPRSWFLMRFLMRFLTFDEVLDEVLDSQWGSCPRPHRDLDVGTITLRFSMRKIYFRKGVFGWYDDIPSLYWSRSAAGSLVWRYRRSSALDCRRSLLDSSSYHTAIFCLLNLIDLSRAKRSANSRSRESYDSNRCSVVTSSRISSHSMDRLEPHGNPVGWHPRTTFCDNIAWWWLIFRQVTPARLSTTIP